MTAGQDSYDPVDRTRLGTDPWRLVEHRYDSDPDKLGVLETLFAIGNGYLGMRGNPEEGRGAKTHGTFINGFHDTWPIKHAEEAFGFARTGQTIVNVPDAKVMKIYVDDEPLTLPVADLTSYERSLDFREGILRRSLVWRTPAGKRVRIDSSRMISFTDRHLAVMELEIEMLEGDAPIVVSSQILNRQDGRDVFQSGSPQAEGDEGGVVGGKDGHDPRRATHHEKVLFSEGHWHSDTRMLLGYSTAHSHMTLAVGADHTITTENGYETLSDTEPDQGRQIYRIDAREGVPIRITKAVAYHSSRGIPVRELYDRCRRTLDRVRDNGVEDVQRHQYEYLEAFWSRSDVRIAEHPVEQQAVRWCLFQLVQASARADQMGIAAKGVTGDGYEGHYFWDTDIYVVPFLTYTTPQWARNALRFRVNLLPAARARARDLSQRGALFPWRTINGEEASAYYAAGTAQYHIDADVAHAFTKYGAITGDKEFIERDAAPVLAETARMWADLGFWRYNSGRTFHIHGVTGPDEYTTVVNNNLYTNVMARENLYRAAELFRTLRSKAPEQYARLADDLDLDPREISQWQAAAEGMYIPFDTTFGIHPQDDTFLDLEVWDVAHTPEDRFPLLLNYHPLVIYRFQVIKQADVVLGLFLQGDQFTEEQKLADFQYYDPLTTGDSTLSGVVQSIIAAEVGYPDLALTYFRAGLFVDLADLHHNAADGVHIASAGGVWNSLAYGFGGLRDYNGKLTFDPRLPASWPSLSFPLTLRGSRMRVTITQGAIELIVEDGDPRTVSVRGQEVEVTTDGVRVPLDGQGPDRGQLPDVIAQVGVHRADGSLVTMTLPEPTAPIDFEESEKTP